MSNPSHAALSRIHTAWQAHKEHGRPRADDEYKELREAIDAVPGLCSLRIISLPPLTPIQQAD